MNKAQGRSRETLVWRAANKQGLVLNKSRRAADRGSWYVLHPTRGLVAGPASLEDVERLVGRA